MWAGVDVGGRRKGFHAAVVDGEGLVAGPRRIREPRAVVAWLRRQGASLVAVDSPRAPAPDGHRSRPCERVLARAVCALRYTPDRATLRANPGFYDWVLQGLRLYGALDRARLPAIECFPTAAWTRWAGPRGDAPRGRWSQAALAGLGLAGLPARLDQDGRDAIGAALTARAFTLGTAECFGDIVVPGRSRQA